jgi:hypothetical protein
MPTEEPNVTEERTVRMIVITTTIKSNMRMRECVEADLGHHKITTERRSISAPEESFLSLLYTDGTDEKIKLVRDLTIVDFIKSDGAIELTTEDHIG